MDNDALKMMAALVIAVISAAWARRAAKRRSIGTEPRCSRCLYDLRGHPQLTEGNCPECGAELNHHGAVRYGMPRRQHFAFYTAMALLALGGTLAAVNGGRLLCRMNWLPYEPLKWVVAQTKPGSFSDAAFTELVQRARDDRISTSQASYVADVALAYQTTASTAWDRQWAYIIQQLHNNGHLSANQWNSYLDNLTEFQIDSISPVRLGARPGMIVSIARGRGNVEHLWIQWHVASLVLDGVAVNGEYPTFQYGDRDRSVIGSSYLDEARINLPATDHPGRVRYEIIIEATQHLCRFSGEPEIERVLRRKFDGTFDVVPAQLLPPESVISLRPSMLNAVNAYLIQSGKNSVLRVGVRQAPWSIAASVAVRDSAGRTVQIKDAILKCRSGETVFHEFELPLNVVGAVAVILQPSAQAAADLPDLWEPWPGEIVVNCR